MASTSLTPALDNLTTYSGTDSPEQHAPSKSLKRKRDTLPAETTVQSDSDISPERSTSPTPPPRYVPKVQILDVPIKVIFQLQDQIEDEECLSNPKEVTIEKLKDRLAKEWFYLIEDCRVRLMKCMECKDCGESPFDNSNKHPWKDVREGGQACVLWQLIQDNDMEGEELMQDPNLWLETAERHFQNVEATYWEESIDGQRCPGLDGGLEEIAKQIAVEKKMSFAARSRAEKSDGGPSKKRSKGKARSVESSRAGSSDGDNEDSNATPPPKAPARKSASKPAERRVRESSDEDSDKAPRRKRKTKAKTPARKPLKPRALQSSDDDENPQPGRKSASKQAKSRSYDGSDEDSQVPKPTAKKRKTKPALSAERIVDSDEDI